MPSPPPDALRATATREDAAALEQLCGAAFALEDLPALLDPRGLRFQRLEWMGDAILDALLAQHRYPRPGCCDGLPLEQLASDAALTARAHRLHLAAALDWTPSPGRLADLVEALVGAAWRVGPLAAVQVAEVLVHPRLTVDVVAEAHDSGCGGLRDAAQLGAAVLEAAASTVLVEEQPQADEGELSTRRHRQLSGHSLVPRGQRLGLAGDCAGDLEHRLDHVQAAVGRASAAEGLLAGMRLARSVLAAPAR